MAEHNIRHALPQGVQLPRPPVNNRLPRAGPGGELGVEPTREWVRRRLARPRRRPRTRRCSTDLWRSTRRPCRRSRRHPWPCLRPPGSMSSPPRRSHDVADCADTTFYLLQPFEHATVAGCADCLLGSPSSCRPRGALLVESAKQASLALLAVVARLGWSAARWVIEGDHRCRSFVQAILLVSPSECVVCIPRHQQHFEIERAEGAAASVVPTAIDSGTGAGILCQLCVTSFPHASTSYQEA